MESYDRVIAFSRQAALRSPVKPLYVFCGVPATTLFGVPGSGALEGESAVWSRKENGERTLKIIGEGDTVTPFTLEAEAVDFSVAIMTSGDAEKGGFYQFCSNQFTFEDLAATYKKIRGADCSINCVMTVYTCKQAVEKAREEAEDAGQLAERWKKYIGAGVRMVLCRWNIQSQVCERE